MPIFEQATVMHGNYTTYPNAQPQVLSNGWVVGVGFSSSTKLIRFRYFDGSSWNSLAVFSVPSPSVYDIQMAVDGTLVFLTYQLNGYSYAQVISFDATKVDKEMTHSVRFSESLMTTPVVFSQTKASLVVDPVRKKIHYACLGLMSSYTSTNNLYLCTGTYTKDGRIKWGGYQQVSTYNDASMYFSSVVAFVNDTGTVGFVTGRTASSSVHYLELRYYNTAGGAWSLKNLYGTNSFSQSDISAIYIPPSVPNTDIPATSFGELYLTWTNMTSTPQTRIGYITFTGSNFEGGMSSTGLSFGEDGRYSSLSISKRGECVTTWRLNANASTFSRRTMKMSDKSLGPVSSFTLSSSQNGYIASLRDPLHRYYMRTPPFMFSDGTNQVIHGEYYVGADISPSTTTPIKATTPAFNYGITPPFGSTVSKIEEYFLSMGSTPNVIDNPISYSRTFNIDPSQWENLNYYEPYNVYVKITSSDGSVITYNYKLMKVIPTTASLGETTLGISGAVNMISREKASLRQLLNNPSGDPSINELIKMLSTSTHRVRWASGTQAYTISNSNYKIVTFPALDFYPTVILATVDNHPDVSNYGLGIKVFNKLFRVPSGSVGGVVYVNDITVSETNNAVSVQAYSSASGDTNLTMQYYAFGV